MLNSETKRKIDSARNILVGKVPDPKAQVEQITTAMIYKFMDDMDQQNLEVDLKPQFFVGDYAKYSWTKLLNKKLSGQERLDLYVQAISNMPKNSHIPQLFRDIFKNAFLPFRDARTLSLFLKEINEFSYDHSEDLGNAFEYLLSILGSQGDAGQFRTPRHIIDFIAEVVDPKKNETILDPACGTAGFLISAYKHILKAHDGLDNKTGKPTNKETNLTPDEKTKLMNNIVGYDISPDMVKLSLVNMYLHGFQNPKVYEYDTLSSEKRWDEQFDVIMANPPFMTPKGGIQPHKKFSIQANRAEVLFVDYIMEHLSINGRAGIIVPEGIIFKGDKAYKALRKKLVEDGLFAVVSLPAGVFQPYSGVKTSVLFFDNQLAKKAKDILFVKVENDGFDLGAQRRKIDKNDLPIALHYLDLWRETLINGGKKVKLEGKKEWDNGIWVDKKKIAESGDCNLTGERYREVEVYKNVKWEMVELGEVLEYEQPTKYIVESVNYDNSFKTPVLTAGKTFILGYTNETEGIMPADKLPVIIFDDFTTAIKFVDFPFKVKSSAMKILHTNQKRADAKFLFQVMKTIEFRHDEHKRYWISEFSKIKIPLPPIEVQKEIVEQIEVKQNAINHAKEIIKNLERERRYFGQELRKLKDVEMVELREVCEFNPKKSEIKDLPKEQLVSFIPMTDLNENQINFRTKQEKKIKDVYSGYTYFAENDVLLARVTPCFENGKAGIAKNLTNKIGFGSSEYFVYRADKDKILSEFIYYFIASYDFIENGKNSMSGTGGLQRLTKDYATKYKIPLPSLKIQRQLVAEAEKEEEIITTNKKLIEIMERKIEKVISEI
ncbi:MAG: N-6 DNA methylase [Candidatus Omnitrophica bacterium]|nr:N-6 DNA methylase [Candidatus Omnitrophota bacterium]